MRKIVLLLCATFMMAATVPAFAQDTKADKNECLLASENCANEVDSIQKKVRKLNNEIKKGTKVYTPEELKKLKAKLDETNAMLDQLLEP